MNYVSHYGTVISLAVPKRDMPPPKKSGKVSITLFFYWCLAMVKVGYDLCPWSTHGNIPRHINASIGHEPARLFLLSVKHYS